MDDHLNAGRYSWEFTYEPFIISRHDKWNINKMEFYCSRPEELNEYIHRDIAKGKKTNKRRSNVEES